MQEKEVGKEICRLQNHIHRRMENTRPENGLPRAQGRMLGFIAKKSKMNEISQKDIENEFNLRRSSATETLQKLEASGMIERVSDNKDKRIKRIQITEKGNACIERIDEGIQVMESILQKDISEEDLNTFYRVIDKMIENCEQVQMDKKGEIV